MRDDEGVQTFDKATGQWVDATPEPLYRPPRFRSILWAWLRGRPAPEWQATTDDPNPHERRWRRG